MTVRDYFAMGGKWDMDPELKGNRDIRDWHGKYTKMKVLVIYEGQGISRQQMQVIRSYDINELEEKYKGNGEIKKVKVLELMER